MAFKATPELGQPAKVRDKVAFDLVIRDGAGEMTAIRQQALIVGDECRPRHRRRRTTIGLSRINALRPMLIVAGCTTARHGKRRSHAHGCDAPAARTSLALVFARKQAAPDSLPTFAPWNRRVV